MLQTEKGRGEEKEKTDRERTQDNSQHTHGDIRTTELPLGLCMLCGSQLHYETSFSANLKAQLWTHFPPTHIKSQVSTVRLRNQSKDPY